MLSTIFCVLLLSSVGQTFAGLSREAILVAREAQADGQAPKALQKVMPCEDCEEDVIGIRRGGDDVEDDEDDADDSEDNDESNSEAADNVDEVDHHGINITVVMRNAADQRVDIFWRGAPEDPFQQINSIEPASQIALLYDLGDFHPAFQFRMAERVIAVYEVDQTDIDHEVVIHRSSVTKTRTSVKVLLRNTLSEPVHVFWRDEAHGATASQFFDKLEGGDELGTAMFRGHIFEFKDKDGALLGTHVADDKDGNHEVLITKQVKSLFMAKHQMPTQRIIGDFPMKRVRKLWDEL